MGVSLKLTPQSQRIINNLAKAGKIDLKPVFKVIGEGYRKEVKMIFERKQPRGRGLRWQPLSPSYAKQKQKKYGNNPLLVATGRLKLSMTSKGHPENIKRIGSRQAVFGSDTDYGKFHDEGTSKMPQRNFSEPSERRLGIFKSQIEDYLIDKIESTGVKVTKGIFV